MCILGVEACDDVILISNNSVVASNPNPPALLLWLCTYENLRETIPNHRAKTSKISCEDSPRFNAMPFKQCLDYSPKAVTPYPMHLRSFVNNSNDNIKSIPESPPQSPCSRRSSSSTVSRLIRFLENSNAEKKIELTTHERLMETPRPRYIRGLKN